MRTDTLIVCMAHGKASDTVWRHMKEWIKHDCEILYFCPTDDPIKGLSPQFLRGTASHHGDGAIRRFRLLLDFLSRMNYEQFFITEYDSMFLGKELPKVFAGHIQATYFSEPHPEVWGGSCFLHPPLLIHNSAMVSFSVAAKELAGSGIEAKAQGFWDRLLGIYCGVLGIPIIKNKWGVDSWSKNTIEDADIPEVVAAIENGAEWIHGIKTQKVYDAVCEARGWKP